MLDTMQAVSALCRAHGVAFIYPKALEHLPDMGRDIDLLVLSRSMEVDGYLRNEFHAVPLPIGIRGRIGGSTRYRLPGCPALLDIQHGRLGLLGENTAFPAALLRRCGSIMIGGEAFDAPSREDQLVLQGMQRVFGRTSLRLSDVASTILLLRGNSLDWEYVLTTSQKQATLTGLSCYLSYVDQIHAQFLGERLPCPARGLLISKGWGNLDFRDDKYRFPAGPVNCRLYLQRLGADPMSRRWSSAGRLALIPPVSAVAQCVRALRGLRH